MIEGEPKIEKREIGSYFELPSDAKIIIPNEFLDELKNIENEADNLSSRYNVYRYFALKQLFKINKKTEAESELDPRHLDTGGTILVSDRDEREILSTVDLIKKVQGEEKRQVKILEIGAGETYGTGAGNDCWRPPHKSRAAAIYFGVDADITVCDIKSDNLKEAFVIVESNQESDTRPLHFRGFGFNKDMVAKISATTGPTLVRNFDKEAYPRKDVSPELIDKITRRTLENPLVNDGGVYSFPELNAEETGFLNQAGFNLDTSGGMKYFVRPVVDRVFEKIAFGINAKGGVDFYDLKKNFPNEKFDLVFAVMLDPITNRNKIKTDDILAPNGKINIEIDRSF